jgi:hypothetical protein
VYRIITYHEARENVYQTHSYILAAPLLINRHPHCQLSPKQYAGACIWTGLGTARATTGCPPPGHLGLGTWGSPPGPGHDPSSLPPILMRALQNQPWRICWKIRFNFQPKTCHVQSYSFAGTRRQRSFSFFRVGRSRKNNRQSASQLQHIGKPRAEGVRDRVGDSVTEVAALRWQRMLSN